MSVPTADVGVPSPSTFRLGFAPGVNPAKWLRVWAERRSEPLELIALPTMDRGDGVLAGIVDAAIVRGPINDGGLSGISLYEEVPVVIVLKDHVISAFDEVSLPDLADEVVLHPLDDRLEWDELPGLPARERPATTADAIALVAAGIGVLVVPKSLARLHERKDLTYREVAGAPTSGVVLTWTRFDESELIEEFVGIVRGRTAKSSRGRAAEAEAEAAVQAAKEAKTERIAKAAAARGAKIKAAKRPPGTFIRKSGSKPGKSGKSGKSPGKKSR